MLPRPEPFLQLGQKYIGNPFGIVGHRRVENRVGQVDAVQRGLEEELGINIKVLDYSEHALTSGSGAQAASYIHMMDQDRKRVTYGIGISSNITRASLRGIVSAVNRLYGDN